MIFQTLTQVRPRALTNRAPRKPIILHEETLP